MALKLYMSKAYDEIEWGFLEATMLKMGFDQSWVRFVMQCIDQFVSYSLIFNGVPQQAFRPSRGTRLGDPLSPYLFRLCAEVLGSNLMQAERQKAIIGIPIARAKFSIMHIFLLDDSLLFCKTNVLEWSRPIHILNLYERASSQKLNKENTSILGTPEDMPKI